MPFNIALSGIRAANSDLRITGNNIANASTTGFKESRAEFGDVYSTSVLGSGLNQVGSGIRTQNVSQQYTQGNISFTDNVLDLAISGSGFFVMDLNGEQMFTRAGTFSVDDQGYIVNNINARLQGYAANSNGTINNVLGDIQIQTSSIEPQTTTLIESEVNMDSREQVLQSTGTQYVSSGGSALANTNGYTAQNLTINNPSGGSVNVTTALNDNSLTTANTLNALAGVTATAQASATVSAWTSGLTVNINGATLTNTDISAATATEITNLPGLSATYNAGAGTLSITSTIGDLEFSVTGSGAMTDEVFTVAGPTGATQTLEVDGAGDTATTGNLNVSGSFTGATATLPLNLSPNGYFTGAAIGSFDLSGAGATDHDFTITVDGVTSAANISVPNINHGSYAAMATAIQTAINADVNISGVTVAYDTDHFVITSSGTGGTSNVSLTAVGGSAGAGLGITGGTSTVGVDATDYDFTITVDGTASAANISLPPATYASYAAMATALETAINADTNISGVSVIYDTDHFVFTSGSTGTSSTVALTAVGADAATLGIAGGTSVAGTSGITVGGAVTLQLDEGYSLTDTSGTPIFNNPSTNFVNNAFDPTDPDTYNHSTSVTIYDSLGNSHVMQQFFIKQPEGPLTIPNHWQMVVRVDGRDVGDPVITAPTVPTQATYNLYFDANGGLDTAQSDDILISNWVPYNSTGTPIYGALQPDNQSATGALPIPSPPTSSNFQILMTGSTQVGSAFEVRSVDQDGTTTGRLASLNIDDDGIIFARYTNGENQAFAQVSLADFPNSQGLQALGDTSWAQTAESGEPAIGAPGTASLGLIQSGALEDSNVELSEQLVNLIIAQRNFQASAKTIETADQITQTIINLR